MFNYSSVNMFEALYDLSQSNLLDNEEQISYYSGIIYRNIYLNQIDNFLIFRTSIIEINNYLINNKIKDFTQEKYYILNKVIIEWTKENYNKTNGFVFINSWNNYQNGNYLEPDEKYGFGSINSFSKALFNLPFKENNFNISILNTKSFIAVQAHIYYEELIFEIINKTNNIPKKFDLFITTISLFKKNEIEKNIKRFSKADNYEIKIVENKGRDILPFIIQMKKKIKNYKYFCHIHTKKSKHDINLGGNWRNYLYENLLGSKEIVSQILNDFENIEKLGFIFPEVYYDIIKNVNDYESIDFPLHRPNIYFMNFILKKIAPGFEIGNKLVFPTGDMFWSKVIAVHQIFKINFIKKFPKELNQTNVTIMHGIERIWLYLVKINGYFYKVIFKHY